MADEPLTIHGINWREAFPFTNLFRAFRVSIHPSKIVLALLALILLYTGGQVLDLLWPVRFRAVPGEVSLYEQFAAHAKPGQNFSEIRENARQEIESVYASELLRFKLETNVDAANRAAHDAADLGQLKQKIIDQRDQPLTDAEAHGLSDDASRAARRSAFASASDEYREDLLIKNEGLFDVLFEYESNQLSNVVRGVERWNWFEDQPDNSGVISSLVRFFTVGPVWLLTQHPLYFLLFGLMFLVLWSIFGGAISRIAAVHIARDEKLSIRSALVFSGGKFLSFLFAPIIPLLIVAGMGLLVGAGSLLGNIPFLGPIILGLVFFLALAGGFVMALVLLGMVGGFNLMYPTVAVEGSDSFDAISRSFSYLYARPWRLAFYTIVSIVYGAATYIFVHLFVYLILVLTHKAVGIGVFASGLSTAPLWTSLWPSPSTSGRLTYDIDSLSLNFSQEIGARLIWLWVHLVISLLGAFAVSFYFSASTIIYYLMRREVDATDIDDVYLDQVDDEYADPATTAASTAPAAVDSEPPTTTAHPPVPAPE